MLTRRILSAIFRNTEFLVQDSVWNIVAGLIRIKAFTVGADISKFGHYTQELYKLLLIHFIKITGYFGLDVLCCELIEFRECTECYAVDKNPQRDIPINLTLMVDVGIITVVVCEFIQRRNQSGNASSISPGRVVVRRIQIRCLGLTIFFGKIIGEQGSDMAFDF